MVALVFSVAPIFLLIALGYLLKTRGLFTDRFWTDVERLTFYVLFPSLLVSSIGGADLGRLLDLLPMAAALIAATLTVAAVTVAVRTRLALAPFDLDGAAFCSLFQGVTRPNTYIGLAAAFSLFGEHGLALMAICIVAIIPLVNVLAVLVHQRWAVLVDQRGTGPSGLGHEKGGDTRLTEPLEGSQSDPRASVGRSLMNALKNPVVAACLIGAALNVTGFGLPPVVGPMLNILGKGALPLGLMAVGAGLNVHALAKTPTLFVAISTIKLLILPALTWTIAQVVGVEGISVTVATLFAALPISATSYVMSRQMNGNSQLMAALVSATTLASLLTIPIIVVVII